MVEEAHVLTIALKLATRFMLYVPVIWGLNFQKMAKTVQVTYVMFILICLLTTGIVLYTGQPHVRSWDITATSIAASWEPPVIEGTSNKSFSYSLSCSKSGSNTIIPLNTGTDLKGNITALEPYTNYSCCILASASRDGWFQVCSTIRTNESGKNY